ncbi:glycosyltransferase family 2 protein [Bradyrhizobium japonicum]|uniref:glycosyltransferase family 2 protein n=1 Tax=Bradyrhizobium TaxID=374 RepID=UPI0013747257|nr:glycosyltransferase [Bradyrhizobium japonicum]
MTRVSIIIKAYNEEVHIASAIESALAALPSPEGEVVLVDSASVDKTLECALPYPISIFRIANASERCCGAGPQIGYAHAKGDFLCLMDGDMVLDKEFIKTALAFLNDHPDVAGVGGRIDEMSTENIEFKNRARNLSHLNPLGEVDRLAGGGLYRRSAIDELGYLTDRNLHGYEEFDLGARLRSSGWKLVRLNVPAAKHFGHTSSTYRLLFHRVKMGYIFAPGEMLRASINARYFARVIRSLREFKLWVAVLGYWSAFALLTLFTSYGAAFAALALLGVAAIIVALTVWKKSFSNGTYMVIGWHVFTIGMLFGLFRPRISPLKPLTVETLRLSR